MPDDPWFTEAQVLTCAKGLLLRKGMPWAATNREFRERYLGYARAALSAIPDPRAAGYAEGLSRGFDAGFGISGKGWNGEMKPDHCQDSYYQARKATEIAALKPEPRP